MSDELMLEIVTPDKSAFSGMVEQVTVPGVEGEFGVLKSHAALLTLIDIGELSFLQEGKRNYYAINAGYVEVASDKVTILVETAESADEIDAERAMKAKERAQAELDSVSPEADYDKAKAALKRAIVRLSVATKG